MSDATRDREKTTVAPVTPQETPEDRTTGRQAAHQWNRQLTLLGIAVANATRARLQMADVQRAIGTITAQLTTAIHNDPTYKNADARDAVLTLRLDAHAEAEAMQTVLSGLRRELSEWTDAAELARGEIRRLDRLIDLQLAEVQQDSVTSFGSRTSALLEAIRQ